MHHKASFRASCLRGIHRIQNSLTAQYTSRLYQIDIAAHSIQYSDTRAVSSAGLEQGTSNSQVGGSSPPRLATSLLMPMEHKRADLAFFVHIDVNKFVFAEGMLTFINSCTSLQSVTPAIDY